MYCVRKVTNDLYWVGANDHRLALFANCFPIPRGVTYNAYCLLEMCIRDRRKELHPGEKPEVCFALCEGDEVEAVYAYCNLHSLWKA